MAGKSSASKTGKKPARNAAGSASRPLVGIAAGAAVGSAAIAAALIFAGKLRNPFVDGVTGEDRIRRPSRRRAREAPAAFAEKAGSGDAHCPVRDSGPENIRDADPAHAWDRTDEASDESFPASDPPAHY